MRAAGLGCQLLASWGRINSPQYRGVVSPTVCLPAFMCLRLGGSRLSPRVRSAFLCKLALLPFIPFARSSAGVPGLFGLACRHHLHVSLDLKVAGSPSMPVALVNVAGGVLCRPEQCQLFAFGLRHESLSLVPSHKDKFLRCVLSP